MGLLNTLLGGTSKIWAGLNNGTIKELSLSGHTHSTSEIVGSIESWVYVTSLSRTVRTSTTGDDVYSTIYTLNPYSYISYLFVATPTISNISGYNQYGIHIDTYQNNEGTNSWMLFDRSGIKVIKMYTFGAITAEIENQYAYLFINKISNNVTSVTVNVSIYGIKSPL